MKRILKGALALSLAIIMMLSAVSCAGQKKSTLDVEKFPLVFADENGLEAMNEGDTEPQLITKNFYTFSNAASKVQAASNGKIYYIETRSKKKALGDLYAYDVEKKEAELVHSGVYSFKVSHDGECLIISDGLGGIFKYSKKHEKKDDYIKIQQTGVSAVLDISADGKYVLYSQVLKGTTYYSLTMAKTDFETTEELDKLSVEKRLENKDISKAPVIICENYKNFVGASDDLSTVYYEKGGDETDAPNKLCVYKNYKDNAVLTDMEHNTWLVNANGEICYSTEAVNTKKVSDVLTDKYEKKDAKLKKKSASAKDWKAKQKRDNVRENVGSYLKNITTYSFYRYSKSTKEPKQFLELNGQLIHKNTDEALGKVFFGATLYDFSKAEKPDINKVSVVYKLFDNIKKRCFSALGFDGLENLEIEKAEYNSGDVYVDTANKKINIIMDFDYLKKKVGTLYTVAYDAEGFGNTKLISDKAANVAHFDNKDGVYFVSDKGNLVLDNLKTVVMEGYAYSVRGGKAKIAFTSVPTGEKDDYGNAITDDTAYLIEGKKATKLGKMFTAKEIVTRGDMFAYYQTYDYKASAGKLAVFNGEKLISLDKQVGMVYSFSE